MGEVRVKAKLMNPFDEELVHRGQLSPDQVRVYEADAVVDTGAVGSVLPVHVVQQLGVRIRAQRVVELANGQNEVVGVTGPVSITIAGRDTILEMLVVGNEVLIGQTVLEMIDMLVDCTSRQLIPNPAHPDQPVLKLK